LWDKEFDAFNITSMAKFRTKDDVNQYVFSWYDICSGNFLPKNKNTGRCFTIKAGNHKQLIESINEEQKVKYIKRDRGLLERTENEEKIILAEDNRQVLLG
jgi:hypothetical protein